jgi:23S rRNA pseudouridine1911/1915/1917 synthase
MSLVRPATKRRSTPGPATVHKVPPYGAHERLDAYLTRYLGEHSRSEWQRLIESGIVTVNGQQRRPSERLSEGDRLEVKPIAAFSLLEPDASIKLDIVYEDPAIIMLNKPAGLVVHPAPGHERGTLVHGLIAHFPELHDPTGQLRPGIIHRLDKDTSGLLVVGKTLEAIAAVQRDMQAGKVLKRYWLLVHGNVAEDHAIIEVPVGRDPVHRQRMSARPEGKAARTEFTVLERLDEYTFIEATLGTGRTHQLRVHFEYIHHPVAGDRGYGSRRGPEGLTRQFLHSHELVLTSPATREQVARIADLPADLQMTLDRLRKSSRRHAPSAAGTMAESLSVGDDEDAE